MHRIINTFIVLISLAAGLLIIDLLFFKQIIPHLSLNKVIFLERPMRTLAQTSKQELIPHRPYLAVVGDSYAKGNGDWFLDCDKNIAPPPPYQATHIMHKMLGMDIIAIARAGGDPIRTYTSDLVNQYNYINNMWIYDLPEPDMILFYFYGGNDLNDSLIRLKRYYPDYDEAKIRDPKFFKTWLDEFVKDNRRYFPLVNFTSAAYVGKTAAEYMDRLRDSVKAQFRDTTERPNTIDWSRVNVISLNGRNHRLETSLQNFSLELDDEEFSLGMYLFEQALDYACSLYPNATKGVVYIPPVLDCYTFTSPYVLSTRQTTPKKQRELGLRMETEVKRIATKRGLLFINTAPALRNAAKTRILHGPKDLDHLNKDGQHVFAKAIAKALFQAGWSDSYRDFSYMKAPSAQ